MQKIIAFAFAFAISTIMLASCETIPVTETRRPALAVLESAQNATPTIEYRCKLKTDKDIYQITDQQRGEVQRIFGENGTLIRHSSTIKWSQIIHAANAEGVTSRSDLQNGTAELTLERNNQPIRQYYKDVIVLKARLFSPHSRAQIQQQTDRSNEVGEVIISRRMPPQLRQSDDGWAYFGIHGELLYTNRSDSPQSILFFNAPVADLIAFGGNLNALTVMAVMHQNPIVTKKGTSYPVTNKRLLGTFELSLNDLRQGVSLIEKLERQLDQKLALERFPTNICERVENSNEQIFVTSGKR